MVAFSCGIPVAWAAALNKTRLLTMRSAPWSGASSLLYLLSPLPPLRRSTPSSPSALLGWVGPPSRAFPTPLGFSGMPVLCMLYIVILISAGTLDLSKILKAFFENILARHCRLLPPIMTSRPVQVSALPELQLLTAAIRSVACMLPARGVARNYRSPFLGWFLLSGDALAGSWWHPGKTSMLLGVS